PAGTTDASSPAIHPAARVEPVAPAWHRRTGNVPHQVARALGPERRVTRHPGSSHTPPDPGPGEAADELARERAVHHQPPVPAVQVRGARTTERDSEGTGLVRLNGTPRTGAACCLGVRPGQDPGWRPFPVGPVARAFRPQLAVS